MSRPWYRRFPDNFIAGTVGLTLEEKGAYSLVLDLMYVRGGPVPDEPRYIAGVCNCSVRKWNAIREKLIGLGKIHVVDGYLTNERAEKEIENAAKDAQERAENGSKGGNKTAENRTNTNKFNGTRPASVQPTRATQNQHQIKKEGNLVLVGGEEAPTILLDRIRDEDLFKACEAINGNVKVYLQRFPFPREVVAQAKAGLGEHAA
ncbi:YdaU family protein [Devosia sp. 2618]|uniref:YdaU family protein n=1 Tax=Devosia sp. 2618 TaxID=3156454 RepID=UPI003391C418